MKHCYFRDPNQPTPYIQASAATALTPNFNHRKVVQYYLGTDGSQNSDRLDDEEGHGTLVAVSKFFFFLSCPQISIVWCFMIGVIGALNCGRGLM